MGTRWDKGLRVCQIIQAVRKRVEGMLPHFTPLHPTSCHLLQEKKGDREEKLALLAFQEVPYMGESKAFCLKRRCWWPLGRMEEAQGLICGGRHVCEPTQMLSDYSRTVGFHFIQGMLNTLMVKAT